MTKGLTQVFTTETIVNTLFENAPDGILIADIETKRFKFANSKICSMLGYSLEELVHLGIKDLHKEEDLPLTFKFFDQVVSGEIPEAKDLIFKRKDGSLFYANVAGFVMESEGAKYIAGVFRDIADDIDERQKLILANKQFQAVMDSINAVVYVADIHTYELLFINKYVKDMFGDIAGHKCWQTIQINQAGPCLFCTNSRLADAQGRLTGVLVWEFQNTRTKRWFECRDQLIPWIDGRLVRIEIATDITERKETDIALEKAQIALKAYAAQMKDNNTALTVLLKKHEHDMLEVEESIQTNINTAVRPFIELLRRKNDTADKVYLEAMESGLREIVSNFCSKLSSKYVGLTDREILIANLIKDGKQDKDIAFILNIAIDTVRAHRRHIRKKLGIIRSKINLKTYLMNSLKD